MKNGFVRLALASAVALGSVSVFAGPTISASHDNVVIKVPTGLNAADWFLNDDANELYIAPPSNGLVKLSSYGRTTNTGFCEALRTAQSTETRSVSTMAFLSQQADTIAVEASPFVIELDANGAPLKASDGTFVLKVVNGANVRTAWYTEQLELEQEVITASAEVTLKAAQYASEDALLTQYNRDKTTAIETFSTCANLAPILKPGVPVAEACETELEGYLAAIKAVQDQQSISWDAEDAILLAKRDFTVATDTLALIKVKAADTISHLFSIRDSINSNRLLFRSIYEEYSNLEGGTVNVTYNSKWAELVDGFQRSNPTFSVRRLNLKEAVMTAPNTTYEVNGLSVLALEQGILRSSLPNFGVLTQEDVQDVPDGSEAHVGIRDIPTPTLPAFPESFVGDASLSLLNGCVLVEGLEEESIEVQQAGYAQRYNKFISPTISYAYELRANYGYEASYNMTEVMERIEKTTKKTGFFSSSSSHSLEELYEADDVFSITFTADADDSKYFTPEAKEDLKEALRSSLTIRALDAVARRVINTEPQLPEAAETAANGLSRVLVSQCRYGWGYRCYGGWALYALNGIWGGSSSSSSYYKQANDITTVEKFEDGFFIDATGTTTFFETNF